MHEPMNQIETSRGGGDLAGVDIAIHPERRFLVVRSRSEVGDGQQPDITPLIALPDTLYPYQMRILFRIGVEKAC
jgi:hypothetical protein